LNTIAPPKSPDVWPDRSVDCQFALEPAFQKLVAEAVAIGWGFDETCLAVVEVARANMLAQADKVKVETIIATLGELQCHDRI
jgi:hypothetical protein